MTETKGVVAAPEPASPNVGRARPASAAQLLSQGDSWPAVLVLMGSLSDWSTMCHADDVLAELGVDHGCAIVSAHRTPDRLAYAFVHEFRRPTRVVENPLEAGYLTVERLNVRRNAALLRIL